MRRVRTSEGSRYYGLPIGAPITAGDIARARERNKGKPAPKGASSRVRSPASPKVRRAAQQKIKQETAAKSRLVSPVVKVAPPPKPKKGGTKVKAGRTEYSVDKDSRSFTREGSNVVYNVGADGSLRVLAPKGEARLTPEQESKVKALMMAERSSFTEMSQDAPDSAEPQSETPSAPKGTPEPSNGTPEPSNGTPAAPATPDGRPARIPNSLGESVVVDGGDLLDMQKSPLTSPHILPNGEFTPERKALHDKIIAQFFEGVEPVENPTQFMNGGGPASGKGTMTRGDNAKITGYPPTNIVDDFGNFQKVDNPGGVIVDPDQLKLSLPEGQKAVKDFADGVDRTEEYQEWAANLHGESSYLGQRLAQAALERGVNLILDGVNDGSVEGVTRKVMKARALGYRVEANYIYLDPREALDRAMSRAKRAGRRVPPSIILGAYSKLPSIFDGIKDGLFDKVRLFDNNVDGSDAYILGEGSRDGSFEFKAPEFEDVYARFLESAGIAKEMLGLQEVESGAAKAQEKNLKDLSEPPKS